MNQEQPRGGSAFAEINVTPMCDIMIVLLVIFMVVTPMLNQERHLEPPASRTARGLAGQEGPLVLVRADGRIELAGEAMASTTELTIRLSGLVDPAAGRDRLVRVKADRGLRYGQVQAVLAACRAAGARHVALLAVREPGIQ
jgi:biopolymer transport protein ExbD